MFFFVNVYLIMYVSVLVICNDFFVAFLKLVAIVLAYANYVYYAKFQDNALVVGRTNCGKTYFVQKLVVNNFFLKVNSS